VLGMEEIPRPSNFDFPGAWLHKGGALIHLLILVSILAGTGHA
jgi:hypothetical protein